MGLETSFLESSHGGIAASTPGPFFEKQDSGRLMIPIAKIISETQAHGVLMSCSFMEALFQHMKHIYGTLVAV
jgi:hypothetical protein